MACTGATDKYGDGCLGTAIAFTAADDLRGVSPDPFGNVYITDVSASRIRRVSPNGIITTFAGGGTTCTPPAITSANGAGCVPTTASLNKPRGVSADAAGNVFIADYSGDKVYEVRVADGLMYLVAGTGTAGTIGDGGAAAVAEVDAPRSASSDTVGDIYIADTSANKVRVVDTAGNIHTFAGTGTSSSTGDGGPATAATISNPQGITTDANLNVYVTDSGKIRVICVTCGTSSPLDTVLSKLGITSPINGDIYTLAGSGSTSTYSGTLPTLSTNVSMSPQKLSMDINGNLYISDSNGFVWFVDVHTGYIRAIASAATTVCAAATDAYGDGCPATQAKFGSNGGNGFGAGVDIFGNLYVGDSTNLLVRKVITGLTASSTNVASTQTLPVEIHFTAGDGLATSNGLSYTSTEWSLSTPTCSTNADSTSDCLFNAGFTPAIPGARSTPLTVSGSAGSKVNLSLEGVGLGSGATLDPASMVSFGTGLQVAGVAVASTGNVYVSDLKSKGLLLFSPSAQAQGASATPITLATLTVPGAVAVDSRGFVYVADTSTGLVTQVSPSGTTTALPFTFKTPSGLAIDTLNNLYVSDSTAKTVTQINPITGAGHPLISTGLTAPAGLTISPSGNVLIADPGAATLYSYNPTTAVLSALTTPATAPVGIATDAAGNLLIADTAAILAVPASSNSSSFTVAALASSSIATDVAGDVYVSSGGAVVKLQRTKGALQFTSSSHSAQTASLLESGNQSLQLTSVSQTDPTDFTLTATSSTDCALTGTLPSALAVGGVCPLSATYNPGSPAPLNPSDTATFNGNLTNAALSSPSSVQLTLTGPATGLTDSISLNTPSPASPVYGQSVTLGATVTGITALTPAGSVTFTVDSSTSTTTLTSGTATTTLTGLTAGMHTISATYNSTNGYPSASTTSPTTLTVAQATSSVGLTANPAVPISGQPDILTATVTGTGTLNGSVVFSTSTATLCTSSLNGSGVTTCTFTPSASGNLTVTAQYQDANHSSSSINLTLSVASTDFTLSATPTAQTVSAGGSATYTITASGNSGTLYGPIALSATSLPSGYIVRFSPTSLAGGSGTATSTLTIQAPATLAQSRPYNASSRGWLMALVLPFFLLSGYRCRRGRYTITLLLILVGFGTACFTGCSSGPSKAAPANYTVTITATGASTTHTATVMLTAQ
jgi:hypothetical protein